LPFLIKKMTRKPSLSFSLHWMSWEGKAELWSHHRGQGKPAFQKATNNCDHFERVMYANQHSLHHKAPELMPCHMA
jgi:hypothetical protein